MIIKCVIITLLCVKLWIIGSESDVYPHPRHDEGTYINGNLNDDNTIELLQLTVSFTKDFSISTICQSFITLHHTKTFINCSENQVMFIEEAWIVPQLPDYARYLDCNTTVLRKIKNVRNVTEDMQNQCDNKTTCHIYVVLASKCILCNLNVLLNCEDILSEDITTHNVATTEETTLTVTTEESAESSTSSTELSSTDLSSHWTDAGTVSATGATTTEDFNTLTSDSASQNQTLVTVPSSIESTSTTLRTHTTFTIKVSSTLPSNLTRQTSNRSMYSSTTAISQTTSRMTGPSLIVSSTENVITDNKKSKQFPVTSVAGGAAGGLVLIVVVVILCRIYNRRSRSNNQEDAKSSYNDTHAKRSKDNLFTSIEENCTSNVGNKTDTNQEINSKSHSNNIKNKEDSFVGTINSSANILYSSHPRKKMPDEDDNKKTNPDGIEHSFHDVSTQL